VPLCLKDGKLLRPLAPAAPLPESLCTDPMHEEKAYRVIAPLVNGAAAVAAYNLLDRAESKVRSSVSSDDYTQAGNMVSPYRGPWKVPAEGLLLYDWHEQKGHIMESDYTFSMEGFSDKLIYLLPVISGWAVIGPVESTSHRLP